MFKPNSKLKVPRYTLQSLWRYMSIERFAQILETESIYFCPLTAFSDGLEGKLTNRTQDRFLRFQHDLHGPNYNAFGALCQYLEFQKDFLVNCWHINESESYLMWKAYADRGVAIRTTFERACASFDSFAGTITGGVVDYIDFEREETPQGNIFDHIAIKDLPYHDEREFRFILWPPDIDNQPLNISQNGFSVPIDRNMLIEQIYINPFRQGPPDNLIALLKKYDLLDRLYNSRVIHTKP